MLSSRVRKLDLEMGTCISLSASNKEYPQRILLLSLACLEPWELPKLLLSTINDAIFKHEPTQKLIVGKYHRL